MEFHAVILCGPGKQLCPLSKVRTTGIHKPLLPLALMPMFEHVLNWCEKAFFSKITLACGAYERADIEEALELYKSRKTVTGATTDSDSASDSSDTIQFTKSIKVSTYDTSSNGQVLQQVIQQQQADKYSALDHFVLLPCDFLTDLPPQVLIEAYRCRQDSDMGMLVLYRNLLDIEDKKNKLFPKSYALYADSQLLDYYSNEDVEFHKSLPVRTQLAWKHPNISISARLFNSSVFFGHSRQISDFFERHHKKFTEGYFSTRPLVKIVRDMARKSWQSRSNEPTIGSFTIPDGFSFMRANNLPVYMEANRHFLKLQARELAMGKSSASKGKTTAIVGADSIVAVGTVLGERTNVKRSVVGANCMIGKRVKLTGCVILDGVTIQDDVQLENTILGTNAVIHSKSKLINCNVESTHEVAHGTVVKGDTLFCLSLEGLVDSEGQSSSDDEDDSESSCDDYKAEEIDDGLFGY